MQPSRPDGEPSRGGAARWRAGRPQRRMSSRSDAGFQEAAACAARAESSPIRPHDFVQSSPRRPHDLLESSPRRPHDLVVTSSPPAQPSGHIKNMQSLRRSAPSPYARYADMWDLSIARPPSEDIRVRRNRRPADFGAILAGSSSGRRCSSGDPVTSSGQVADSCTLAETLQAAEQHHGRCGSVPPTGTAKADASNADALAKARAIASLQRLFFEEMSKGGHDANSAAVAALRRLSDMPSTGTGAASSSAVSGGAEDSSAACSLPTQGSPACSSVSPLVPHRPALGADHRRRPAPMLRVAVQS